MALSAVAPNPRVRAAASARLLEVREPGRQMVRGTGLDGFRRMFEVWGESEPKPVARAPLWWAATRPMVRMVDESVIDAVLGSAHRPRRSQVDPRLLWASQHGVTWSGVDYDPNQPRYRRTAWTWADQWSRINREVVVWVGPDGPQLLSGHHRTDGRIAARRTSGCSMDRAGGGRSA